MKTWLVSWLGVAVAVLVVAVLSAGCGSSAEPAGSPDTTGNEAGAALASAIRIDSQVDAQIGDADFVGVGEPLDVAVGDSVRTDSSGFAEIAYFDGSLVRLDIDSEVEVLTLIDTPGASETRTRMGIGRTWHRVEALTGGDTYVVETSVATATVRGTAFVVTCTADDCRFDVLEGVVEIALADATTIEVSAGESLTVAAGSTAPPVVEAIADELAQDAWLNRNQDLDIESGFGPLGAPPETGESGDPGEAGESGGELNFLVQQGSSGPALDYVEANGKTAGIEFVEFSDGFMEYLRVCSGEVDGMFTVTAPSDPPCELFSYDLDGVLLLTFERSDKLDSYTG